MKQIKTYRQLAGSQPVYFVWAAEEDGWKMIEANLGEHAMRCAQVS